MRRGRSMPGSVTTVSYASFSRMIKKNTLEPLGIKNLTSMTLVNFWIDTKEPAYNMGNTIMMARILDGRTRFS
jgi:hypothetical protein